jgi:hypothetical protein
VLPSSTEVEDVQYAVDVGAANLTASAPTTCSAECQSHDTTVYGAALVPSATLKLSTTTGSIVPELPELEVADKALDMAIPGDTPPTAAIYLARENSPPPVSVELMDPAVGDLLEDGNNLTLHPPWPPPGYIIRYRHMTQALLMSGFIFESTQLMQNAAKNPWPPPFPNMSKVTLVIIFAPGEQSAQLQPTVFKWSALLCYDTYMLTTNASLDMKLNFLLSWRAPYTAWNWCCLAHLCRFLASTDLVTTLWGMLLSSPDTWVFLQCHSARVQIQWTSVVHRYTSSIVVRKYSISNRFIVIFIGEAKVQQHCSCTRVLIAWSVRYHFYLSVSWLFSCPSLEDWSLPYSTRMVFLTSSGKCQREIAGLLGLALIDMKLWNSDLYSWAVCQSIFDGGPDACIFWWIWFAIQRCRSSHGEYHSSTTILQLHDLHQFSGSTNWALEEQHGQVLLPFFPWPSSRFRINQFPARLFVTEHWTIPWEPGDDSPGHYLMENFTSLASHFIQRDFELMQWKFPLLFSCPVI